ncbi:hypothetical protein ACFWF7_03450, partial [Nocardia sp. NPDC060256]|uniref:hypothetical protein n=1 Tax=Nocardia sp. NPDC060256 TaxID=3347086 RepID=UPI00365F9D42
MRDITDDLVRCLSKGIGITVEGTGSANLLVPQGTVGCSVLRGQQVSWVASVCAQRRRAMTILARVDGVSVGQCVAMAVSTGIDGGSGCAVWWREFACPTGHDGLF